MSSILTPEEKIASQKSCVLLSHLKYSLKCQMGEEKKIFTETENKCERNEV